MVHGDVVGVAGDPTRFEREHHLGTRVTKDGRIPLDQLRPGNIRQATVGVPQEMDVGPSGADGFQGSALLGFPDPGQIRLPDQPGSAMAPASPLVATISVYSTSPACRARVPAVA